MLYRVIGHVIVVMPTDEFVCPLTSLFVCLVVVTAVYTISASLSGANELPIVSTAGCGSCSGTLVSSTLVMSLTCEFTGLTGSVSGFVWGGRV